jgi:GTP pyrophosphokinase
MKLGPRYAEALVYAHALHATQERKGSGVPYLAHLLGVSSLALEHGADEDEAIAALLHDAVEDQGGLTTLAEIERRFGERVAQIVLGCSDSTEEPKPPWRARKERYLAHLLTASPSILLVSGCDKLYNARAIVADHRRVGPAIWSRFRAGRDGTRWYYDELARVFVARTSPVAHDLSRVVAELLTLE